MYLTLLFTQACLLNKSSFFNNTTSPKASIEAFGLVFNLYTGSNYAAELTLKSLYTNNIVRGINSIK
ncbi:hypothetical protein C772_01425 [Bhargavaea cecembensis DSE10]|uniref:Uncharacterized protein n=1 Tax=Bhargavaea cecembensis DSE10 TaxID=1235279 RepID=M7NXX5_9BACL|nr:hypothetical protein C772_01425 [Bhargavaea cecembensis DSE10]